MPEVAPALSLPPLEKGETLEEKIVYERWLKYKAEGAVPPEGFVNIGADGSLSLSTIGSNSTARPEWLSDEPSWSKVKTIVAAAAAAAQQPRKPKPLPTKALVTAGGEGGDVSEDTGPWVVGASVPWHPSDAASSSEASNGGDPFAAGGAGSGGGAERATGPPAGGGRSRRQRGKREGGGGVATDAAARLDEALSQHVSEHMRGRDEAVPAAGRSSERLRGLERASERP